MKKIELTVEEEEILSQALQNSLATLDLELHHTDHKDFKEYLKHRRRVLQGLADKLSLPVPG